MESACHWHQESGSLSHASARDILGVTWCDCTEITEHIQLPPLSDLIVGKCNSLFGHEARLGDDTPAHQALLCQIRISLIRRLPDNTWKRPPGRLRSNWLDQICSDNRFDLPADLCRCAIHWGHSGVTQWFQLTKRWRRWRGSQRAHWHVTVWCCWCFREVM